jgi:hypothetical protein
MARKHKPTKGAFGSSSKAQRRAEELALRLEKINKVDKERKKRGTDNI